MTWIVVAYYTEDTLYEKCAETFKDTCVQFRVPHYVEQVPNLGTWYKNTAYKPVFLQKMLKKFPASNIVYVDVDAVFYSYPILFDDLDCDIGVYVYDHNKHNSRKKGKEVLSGTIFLKNCLATAEILKQWEEECVRSPKVWDQKSLQQILGGRFYTLPGEYCKIFDRMLWIIHPVIEHYQASRMVRKNKGRLQTV